MDTGLDQLPFHIPAQITALSGDATTCQRLAELGMVPGAAVMVRGAAPLGDPLEVHVAGTALSLRKKDAAMVQVRPS